ncbi:hypothetical protein [Natrarchaeobaculum aegyptiacum]|uniref:Flagellin n=1 Tax=Natrarchaeobaculum aegyptiacum TaxID=745377 RepID=A0A2Z2HU34_9EURY|nr:hypothetical protein [Natrarchaeobaculum aegyptiacum]ARS88967.1 hypothetical protein B1756_03820 [Natrarchaeobaculum aegyptiacum]
MGFSTSGAVLVILIGVLVALSLMFPALFNVSAATGEAFSSQQEQLRDTHNFEITIDEFVYHNDSDRTYVNATNTGAGSLSVTDTDVLVNGEYYPTNASDEETVVIDGDSERFDSDVWTPGSSLSIEIDSESIDAYDSSEYDDEDDVDDRVQLTSERGISTAASLEFEAGNGEGSGE